MKFSTVLVICMFCVIYQAEVYAQDWLGKITPLETTVEEVEKLITLRPEKKGNGNQTYEYTSEQGRLTVDFSPGRCVLGKWGKWNVEKGVVIHVFFDPGKYRKLSYYEKNKKSLKKDFDGSLWHYGNLDKGIDYTMQSGKVDRISYYIPFQKQQDLKCKD